MLTFLLESRGPSLVFNGAIVHPRWRRCTADSPWLLERVFLNPARAFPINVRVSSDDLVEVQPSAIQTGGASGDNLGLSVPPQFNIDLVRRSNYGDWAVIGKWYGGRINKITGKEAFVRVMDALSALFNPDHESEIESQRPQTGGMGIVFRSPVASAPADLASGTTANVCGSGRRQYRVVEAGVVLRVENAHIGRTPWP